MVHPAISRISNAFNQLSELPFGKMPSQELCQTLGLDLSNEKALGQLRQVAWVATDPEAVFEIEPTSPGIYFVRANKDSPYQAALHLGERRVNDFAMAWMASKLGLEEVVVPSMPFVLKNPDMGAWERPVDVDLHTPGGYKSYVQKGPKEGTYAVGSIAPYVAEEEIPQVEKIRKYALVVLLGAALGLQDISSDNMKSCRIIDNEEPIPELEKNPMIALVHMPILGERLWEDDTQFYYKTLPQDVCLGICKIVGTWNKAHQDNMLSELKDFKPLVVDEISEEAAIEGGEDSIVDFGGCEVEVGVDAEEDEIEFDKNKPLFSESQLQALRDRLERLAKFFASHKSFSPKEIIASVDESYDQHVEHFRGRYEVQRECERVLESLKREAPSVKEHIESHQRKSKTLAIHLSLVLEAIKSMPEASHTNPKVLAAINYFREMDRNAQDGPIIEQETLSQGHEEEFPFNCVGKFAKKVSFIKVVRDSAIGDSAQPLSAYLDRAISVGEAHKTPSPLARQVSCPDHRNSPVAFMPGASHFHS